MQYCSQYNERNIQRRLQAGHNNNKLLADTKGKFNNTSNKHINQDSAAQLINVHN